MVDNNNLKSVFYYEKLLWISKRYECRSTENRIHTFIRVYSSLTIDNLDAISIVGIGV